MALVGNKIRDAIKPFGYKARSVSISHLPELQETVGKLVHQGLVNQRLSEKWHFYLKTNENLPEAKTIIITALPQSITRLTFTFKGRDFHGEVTPGYFCAADEARAEEILNQVVGKAGNRIVKARLALKTLAVRSGLAVYGKNNLAYVPEMGSFCRLIAFYSDAPCEEDNWLEPEVMKACEKCTLCRDTCPNGSITSERFLIHAENCLGFLQEIQPDFPYWVQYQPDWFHAFLGCMGCQSICPVNKPYLKKFKKGPSFSEEETVIILSRTPWEQLNTEIRRKLDDVRGIYPLMAQNLAALIEKQQNIGR